MIYSKNKVTLFYRSYSLSVISFFDNLIHYARDAPKSNFPLTRDKYKINKGRKIWKIKEYSKLIFLKR
jgi:hypothetical protein